MRWMILVAVAVTLAAAAPFEPVPLLPGSHVFEVADYGATPNDAADDTAAIQAALDAAGEYSNRKDVTAQQVVHLPAGTYLVSDTLRFPKNSFNKRYNTAVEVNQWLYGDGVGQTVIRLRPAGESGQVLGTPEAPQPVVQAAEYRLDNKAGGNINFQLWVTDLSIIVPADQPNAVGLSYGAANMGAVRNVEITAEGDGGHCGLGLVQYNNGPGYVEHVRITGFDIGLLIHDNWGESFTFSDLDVRNQNPGGVAIAMTDKQIAMEQVRSSQDQPDVTGIRLYDDDTPNTNVGGEPHLTLLGAELNCTAAGGATAPAIDIQRGHSYLRNVRTDGYGDACLLDHGQLRSFSNGDIPGEFVSVHGQAIGEQPSVAVALDGALAASLNLPVKPAPEVPSAAWDALRKGDVTVVDAARLAAGPVNVTTAWAIVDNAGVEDATDLLQAALDSGARYIGLLNAVPFVISKTLTINGPESPRSVELIYGLMPDIVVANNLAGRAWPYDQPGTGLLFHLMTGRAETLLIKGLHVIARIGNQLDFQVFQNDAANTVVFEDFRCKIGPRHYRNGPDSSGHEVFIENIEWAYNGGFPEANAVFTRQDVRARNFNCEQNITPDPVTVQVTKEKSFERSRFTTAPRITNDGGTLWSFGQKLGEYNGVFVATRNGGRTELLSCFMNEATSPENFEPTREAACLSISGPDCAVSMVGQERPRGKQGIPHQNTFARIGEGDDLMLLEATRFPTYLRYEGQDPFEDEEPGRYLQASTFRVIGLFRYGR